jgi:hypothetical protein
MRSQFTKNKNYTVAKNNLIIYKSSDETQIIKRLYARAAMVADGENGFLLLSNKRDQKEQFMLLSAISAKVDINRYLNGKLLKNELASLVKTSQMLFGSIESTGDSVINPSEYIAEISKYAKEISYVFIELLDADKENTEKLLQELKQIAPKLQIRVEIGTNMRVAADGFVQMEA